MNAGKYSEWYHFKIVPPRTLFSYGWILIIISILVVILGVVASILYYYRHKISLVFNEQNDKVRLIRDEDRVDIEYALGRRFQFSDLLRNSDNDELSNDF